MEPSVPDNNSEKPAPVKPATNWSDKIYASIGKLLLALLALGALIIGGYYLGTRYNLKLTPASSPTPSVTQSAPSTPQATPTPTPASPATPAAQPTPQPKKVSAGITNQFFVPYTIMVTPGWTDSQTSNTAMSELKLTKGTYAISISQSAGGAGSCLYPGDTAQPMAQVFASFVQITGTYTNFRRGTSDNTNYTICEQKGSNFAYPTSVGYITYSVPASPDAATLAEMDAMIATITK